MAEVTVAGFPFDVLDEDHRALADRLAALTGEPVKDFQVHVPVRQPRQGLDVGLLVFKTGGGRLVGAKRSLRRPGAIRREATVALLRRAAGAADYAVAIHASLPLRQVGASTNPPPLRGWEASEHALVDFGPAGRRLPFEGDGVDRALRAEEAGNPVAFFGRLGEAVAFGDVVGADDRHPGNFVYDLDSGLVLAVDHVGAPAPPRPGDRPPLADLAALASRFLPSDAAARRRAGRAYLRGYQRQWQAMAAALPALRHHHAIDFEVVRARVAAWPPAEAAAASAAHLFPRPTIHVEAAR